MFSKSTFPRLSVNAYNEFRFNYKAMCQRGSVYPETSMFGWKDSGAITDFANMIHAFYFYKNDGYTERLRIFESGNDRGDHGNWSCGTDYYMKLSLTSSGANYYTSADSETWSLIYTSTGSSETPLKVGFTHYEGGDTYFDNAFVRKYASPEPTYAFGTEEP